MKWVTQKNIHVNRTATGWLIRRFLDPAAEILFVDPDAVAAVERREGAIGFDAPGARYPHADALGRCSFEQLVAKRGGYDAALALLAPIVHGADFPDEIDATPESAGLWAISKGFTDVASDDAEILAKASFLYDSLYAHLTRRAAASSGSKRPRA
jgi:hypothetical protein